MASFKRLDAMAVPGHRAGGFTYMAVMLLIAIMGLGMAAAGVFWHTQLQREREQDLLFAGDQIRNAIDAYYNSSPGAVKQYPTSLTDLLKDSRFPDTRRYLRRLYVDPLTGSPEWGLVPAPSNGIVGVYSLGAGKPFKQANFPLQDAEFEHKQTYADWKFAYRPTFALGAPGQNPQ